jgi:hypothetical protein
MKAKDRRELYKKDMGDRHKENYANKDASGRFGSIMDATKKASVKLWKCKEDDHEIYFVPYVVGNQHPRLKAGKIDFVLDVFVHRKIGINEDDFICLNRTYKEPCPICEHQAEMREEGDFDADAVKALNPTRRNIFNIVCMDSAKDEEKGVQVWDVSQWLFTNPLEELSHKKKGGGEIAYADIDEGKIISFRKKGSGVTNTEYTAFEFKDREPIADEILDAAVCLDELIHKPTYAEVSSAFFQTKGEEKHTEKEKEKEDEPEERPAKKMTPKKEEKEEEDVPESKGSDEECPGGAEFGKEYNQYDECRTCEVRKACLAKKDELDAETEEEKPAEKKKILTRRNK